ncbi:6434_t:CDS:1 [Cetraspora pellucida]|uniref:6434_t:CDS:1 n=1 Tax=Cetraspora pellucida TaxID=1433469 RepID=A0ACA9LPA4_9GLOM|nr:6434_t:CDS:1 [Cetraspora pellucida]
MDDQTSNIHLELPLKRFQIIKKLLKEYLFSDVSKNHEEISNLLDEVRETKIWQHAGYESFYKFCQDVIGQDIETITNTYKSVKKSVYVDQNAKYEIRVLKLKRKMRELDFNEVIIGKITEYPRDALHLIIRFFNRFSKHEKLPILVDNLDYQVNLWRNLRSKRKSRTNTPINKDDVKAAIDMVERMESMEAVETERKMKHKEQAKKESDSSDETIREEMDDGFISTDLVELESPGESSEENECSWCDLIGGSVLKCGQCANGKCVECTMEEISRDHNNLAIVDKYYWGMLKRHAKEFAEKNLKK